MWFPWSWVIYFTLFYLVAGANPMNTSHLSKNQIWGQKSPSFNPNQSEFVKQTRIDVSEVLAPARFVVHSGRIVTLPNQRWHVLTRLSWMPDGFLLRSNTCEVSVSFPISYRLLAYHCSAKARKRNLWLNLDTPLHVWHQHSFTEVKVNNNRRLSTQRWWVNHVNIWVHTTGPFVLLIRGQKVARGNRCFSKR